VNAIFRHDYPLAVEPASTPRPLVQKKTLRDCVPIDMFLSAMSFLVVAQSSSEVPEGLMNNPVFQIILSLIFLAIFLSVTHTFHSYTAELHLLSLPTKTCYERTSAFTCV